MMIKISIWKSIRIAWFLPKDQILFFGTIMVNFILEDGKINKTDKDRKLDMEFK